MQFYWNAIFLLLLSCNPRPAANRPQPAATITSAYQKNEIHYFDIGAIPLPPGYRRIQTNSGDFTNWLRSIQVKKDHTVYLYNGQKKQNQDAQFCVLNIPTGNKDLQQCADAVMKMRAMYLYEQGRFDKICFYDNEGSSYMFTEPYSRQHLDKFLEKVFGMCGTASLARQLHTTTLQQMKPGDVLIRGGFPGHAAMVMDMAENDEGEKLFLLAQSYMPAQDIHILKNPSSEELSPWYPLTEEGGIFTPEYNFSSNELKKW